MTNQSEVEKLIEPITLGVIVAALVAKALDRAEDEAVDRGMGVVRHAVDALRERFSREGDQEAQQALERLVDVPDNPELTRSFAGLLDERAERSPELRAELETLVGDARSAGVDIDSITQAAVGDGNVQVAGVNDSQVNVSQAQASKFRS
jgi:hypothetical protein